MSDGPVDRLPSDIMNLLALEKDAYPEDAASREAVFARVERAVILSAPTPPSSGPGGAGRLGGSRTRAGSTAAKGAVLGKLMAVGLAAFSAGGLVGATWSRRSDPAATSAPRPVAVAVTAAPSAALSSAPPPPVVSLDDLPRATPPAETLAPATTVGTERAFESSGDLSRERELLDVARAALGRGTPEDAIVAARRHAERWPHGALAEEREVVLIQALVAAGRRGDAEQRAAQFRRTFPRSMFTPAVAAALEAPPAPSDPRAP